MAIIKNLNCSRLSGVLFSEMAQSEETGAETTAVAEAGLIFAENQPFVTLTFGLMTVHQRDYTRAIHSILDWTKVRGTGVGGGGKSPGGAKAVTPPMF